MALAWDRSGTLVRTVCLEWNLRPICKPLRNGLVKKCGRTSDHVTLEDAGVEVEQYDSELA
jgi:hypothetical protein